MKTKKYVREFVNRPPYGGASVIEETSKLYSNKHERVRVMVRVRDFIHKSVGRIKIGVLVHDG